MLLMQVSLLLAWSSRGSSEQYLNNIQGFQAEGNLFGMAFINPSKHMDSQSEVKFW